MTDPGPGPTCLLAATAGPPRKQDIWHQIWLPIKCV